jgi:hypothetical protein
LISLEISKQLLNEKNNIDKKNEVEKIILINSNLFEVPITSIFNNPQNIPNFNEIVNYFKKVNEEKSVSFHLNKFNIDKNNDNYNFFRKEFSNTNLITNKIVYEKSSKKFFLIFFFYLNKIKKKVNKYKFLSSKIYLFQAEYFIKTEDLKQDIFQLEEQLKNFNLKEGLNFFLFFKKLKNL